MTTNKNRKVGNSRFFLFFKSRICSLVECLFFSSKLHLTGVVVGFPPPLLVVSSGKHLLIHLFFVYFFRVLLLLLLKLLFRIFCKSCQKFFVFTFAYFVTRGSCSFYIRKVTNRESIVILRTVEKTDG